MIYKIFFPLFDHIEGRSNEVRLTHEGLVAHPRVVLVDDPSAADYLIFCQNHLVGNNPFRKEFEAIKDRHKEKSIMLDYDDNPHTVYDADDFRWRLYFKRSCVDRTRRRPIDYGNLPILPTAYCVGDDMVEPPPGHDEGSRSLAVSCLFDDSIHDAPWFRSTRGVLLKFAKRLDRDIPQKMQIGTVSECGPVGRSSTDPRYKECLYDTRIVLHANPVTWEGDARTWEAIASGALVCVDRMFAPIRNPLIDGEHVVFYDFTDEGMGILEDKIRYYLANEDKRKRIGLNGREFVLQNHRPVNRIDELIAELERSNEEIGGSAPTYVERVRGHIEACPHPQPRSETDILVSIATGYTDVDQYRKFVSTLRRTGATCPVFLGISEGPEYDEVKRYLLENGVNYFLVPPISPPQKVINGYRFEQHRQWLSGIEFRYALTIDFRDVYFQRDPFTDIEKTMSDCDLYLMSEFQLLTIGNHPNGVNFKWIADAFGEPAARSIADKVILNCGAILGERKAMIRLLNEYAWVARQQNYEYVDQGILNYLAHTGRLNHCGRIKITRAGRSVVNNCGFTELDLLKKLRPLTPAEEKDIAFIPRDERGRLKAHRNPQGWILNEDGSISTTVHQYDRYGPEVADFVTTLSDYEYPDRVFIRGKNRKYRGEKFLLSSRREVEPAAIESLIARTRDIPVGKKPLLVIDRCFKYGLVFAYGILHNELLFETEEFRTGFFDEVSSPDKCEAFCHNWGYEPLFVNEKDVFPGPG